jgi:subtilisin family serine protease
MRLKTAIFMIVLLLLTCYGAAQTLTQASTAPAYSSNSNGTAQAQYLLTTSPSTVQDVCNRHGLGNPASVWSGSNNAVYLVTPPAGFVPSSLETEVESDTSVVSFERNQAVSLPELSSASAGVAQPTSNMLDGLVNRTVVNFFGSNVASYYVQQPALSILRVPDSRAATGLTGVGTVAVIDTGVDPNHAAFSSVLVPGYDFTRNVAGIPNELNDLNPSVAAALTQSMTVILDSNTLVHTAGAVLPVMEQATAASLAQSTPVVLNQSMTVILDQSMTVILDQSMTVILDSSIPHAFGHGTMTSGLVHLVAPTARIMPLKAFNADGSSDVASIVRAIYYAVDHGANVINMSFEMPASSSGIRAAANYASNHNVILVAAAGNDSSSAAVWPASLSNVLGIGSTSNTDTRSSFSNYGSTDVRYAAPGEAVITTYPGNHYAAAWGTSFSAPLVAGGVVLLQQKNPQGGLSSVTNALDKSAVSVSNMNKGRVDFYKALLSQ